MNFYSSLKKSLYLRYGLGLLTILFSIYMIQAINLNHAIQQDISNASDKNKDIERENIFLKDFYIPYLSSDIAYQVLSHEQGQIFPGEKLIRLEHKQTSLAITKSEVISQTVKPLPSLHPHEAWKIFLQQIMKKNFGLYSKLNIAIEYNLLRSKLSYPNSRLYNFLYVQNNLYSKSNHNLL